MKDFEVKIGEYKGKQVSEVLALSKDYFYWLYHTLWESVRTEEYCFCMEDLWTANGNKINDLTFKKKYQIKKSKETITYESKKAFHHLSDDHRPVYVPLSKITPEMEDAEDTWCAENQENISRHKN
ncbi:hypothetical protein GW846_03320 [Candidatus Gracilibacteria bacterium]|nr:hypothetical protein [Candidatus Gracilibacteria bacterium]